MHLLRLILVLLVLALPAAAQDSTLYRFYRVEGRNVNGTPYAGDLRLSRSGRGIRGDWTIAGERFRGIGVLEGRILTLQWEDNAPPVVYVLMPDGALHGTWANGRALERAVPVE